MNYEKTAKLRDLVRECVERAAGVPWNKTAGVAVSGGLDSSSVLACAPNQDDLVAFTGYYDGAAYDERDYARHIAGAAADHIEIRITPEDFLENFDAMVAVLPRPFQGPGALGQYVVARNASEYVEVMLSGEGSDELFGGYARQMIVAGETPPDGYEDYVLPDDYPRDLEAALAYDYERLPNLLAVDDAMLGAFGVEARAPFTDPAIVAFALALEPEERVGKRILRDAMRGIVPNAILDRTDKRGFPTPFVAWAQEGEIREFVLERIGYVPDPTKPWDRGWWNDLLEASVDRIGAPA